MRATKKKILTEKEYLAVERTAEIKSEFFQGEMFGLAGTTVRHNAIVNNVVLRIGSKLKKTNCSFYTLDIKVKIQKSGLYTYPDFMAVCGEPQFIDEEKDVIINPVLIVEVLSPSTEQYDRTTKFSHYRKIETLNEYILIAQESARVEQFVKLKNEQWVYSEYKSLSQSISFHSIQQKLSLNKIYSGIVFDKHTNELR